MQMVKGLTGIDITDALKRDRKAIEANNSGNARSQSTDSPKQG
jgi:hypothetical protein